MPPEWRREQRMRDAHLLPDACNPCNGVQSPAEGPQPSAASTMSLSEKSLRIALDRLQVSPPGPTPTINVEDDYNKSLPAVGASPALRPATPRSSTAPSPPTLQSLLREKSERDGAGLRHRSSYGRSGGHLRSHSSGPLPTTLTRAYSSPLLHSRKAAEPSSPQAYTAPSTAIASWSASPSVRSGTTSPVRVASPFRPSPQVERLDPGVARQSNGAPAWFEVESAGAAFEAIQEDSELDLSARPPLSPLPSLQHTVPRSASSRRRPVSPLHSAVYAPPQAVPSAVTSTMVTADHNPPAFQSAHSPGHLTPSSAHSPSLGPQRYNEIFPSLHHYSSAASLTSTYSSLPSTPTSARSRSPSISSLGTIEDNPDLEVEAMELDRLERLQAAAERADGSADDEDGPRRRSSFDAPRGFGFGSGRGRIDQRKRWSVCGGERRADLDLETIWEDGA